MSRRFDFYVSGMTCVRCSSSVESALRKTYKDALTGVHVDITQNDPKPLTVFLQDDGLDSNKVTQELTQLIQDCGFDCEAYDYQDVSFSNQKAENQEMSFQENLKQGLSSHWFLGILGSVSGISVMLLPLVVGTMSFAGIIALASLSTLLTVLLGARSYYHALRGLYANNSLTMDTLFALSTTSVLVVSCLAIWVPWLPMMFEVGLLIYGFRHIGLAIEEALKYQIAATKCTDSAPALVPKVDEFGIFEVHISQLKPDDVIIIPANSVVPCDGICLEEGLFFDTILTGSHEPNLYRKVVAGMSLCQNIPLKMRVTKDAKSSYLARLDQDLALSLAEKTDMQLQTDGILNYFIPMVLVLAATSGTLVGIYFTPALAIQCALSVLVSACPCTLGLIVPLAVKVGIQKAAKHGVQIKNARLLQVAADANIVVMDLHGTLTTGVSKVEQFELVADANLSSQQFLTLAASLERESQRPIGQAIAAFAKANHAQELVCANKHPRHHAGETAIWEGEEYAIGSLTLMQDLGVEIEKNPPKLHLEAGDKLVYVARGKQLIGYFKVTEPLRADAIETVAILKSMGKEVHLCTGADEPTAQRYAQALKIDTVRAGYVGTLTEDHVNSKAAYIRSLQQLGHSVCMIGDGINDAKAIIVSNFGIAVSSLDSDVITKEDADAVVQSGKLLPIISTFIISKQTASTINHNLLISLAYNLLTVGVSSGLLLKYSIMLNPAIGAALMSLQACIIFVNVYRFKYQALEQVAIDKDTNPAPEHSFNLIAKLMAGISPNLSQANQDIPMHSHITKPANPSSNPLESVPLSMQL